MQANEKCDSLFIINAPAIIFRKQGIQFEPSKLSYLKSFFSVADSGDLEGPSSCLYH